MTIKTPEQIIKMRRAGRLAARVLEMITPYVQPGISTAELETICRRFIIEDLQAIPASLNHHGFPGCICTSINHVVCHGIPSQKKLKNGDILNIDVTVKKDGYIGDTSKMFLIGPVKPWMERLVTVTQECMYRAIRLVRPGVYLGDLGHTISQHASANGYTVVQEYGGHGIGETMWEEPHIPHFGQLGTGAQLKPGCTFTIEPMLNQGKRNVRLLGDGWTVVTADHSWSAQWEHTVLVTETGVEILTLREDETL